MKPKLYKEFEKLIYEFPEILEALKSGEYQVVIRTKPRPILYIRKTPEKVLHKANAFMLGLYKKLKGVKGKIKVGEREIPLSAFIVKSAFKKFYKKKYEPIKYYSLNPEVLRELREFLRSYKPREEILKERLERLISLRRS